MQYHVSVCRYSLLLKCGNRCGFALDKMNHLQTYKDETLDCLFSPRNKVFERGTPDPRPQIITMDDLEFGKFYSVCV